MGVACLLWTWALESPVHSAVFGGLRNTPLHTHTPLQEDMLLRSGQVREDSCRGLGPQAGRRRLGQTPCVWN